MRRTVTAVRRPTVRQRPGPPWLLSNAPAAGCPPPADQGTSSAAPIPTTGRPGTALAARDVEHDLAAGVAAFDDPVCLRRRREREHAADDGPQRVLAEQRCQCPGTVAVVLDEHAVERAQRRAVRPSTGPAWHPPGMPPLPLRALDYHTGGEPFRIVADPPVPIPGRTVAERRAR